MARKTRGRKGILRLPLQKRAELALHKAVEEVIREHARLGLPLYIGRNGKVVECLRTRYATSQDRSAESSHPPHGDGPISAPEPLYFGSQSRNV